MNADEYTNLDRVERTHWYYAGKRELVASWLARSGPLRQDQTLIDCGAGTGIFAAEMASRCRVLVLDDHEESIRILRTRFPEDRILRVSGTGVPLPASSVDYLTALDVLEHIENDRAAVAEFARILRPGGCAVMTVPASMALWSDWDVALHHYRRYDRRGLLALFPASDWEIVHVNYTNVVAFPAVWAIRQWRGLRKGRTASPATHRTEDLVPPRPVNALLKSLFVGLGKLRGIRFPFGVSLILVARRKAQ
jgi:SAM-dependent methyltransferase